MVNLLSNFVDGFLFGIAILVVLFIVPTVLTLLIVKGVLRLMGDRT
jgi:hypothetical protein